MKEKDCS